MWVFFVAFLFGVLFTFLGVCVCVCVCVCVVVVSGGGGWVGGLSVFCLFCLFFPTGSSNRG